MTRSLRHGLLTAFVVAVSMHVIVGAQGTGQNINVVTGSGNQFTGDLFRQKQAEPVIGISSVNPADMMVAYVDYRTVDQIADRGAASAPPVQGFAARVMEFLKAPWRLGRQEITPPTLKTAAFANIGLSFSYNGGKTWASGLMPGRYAAVPADIPPGDDAHRLDEFEAMSDPVLATTPDRFVLGGIAFNSPTPANDCAGCVPGKSVGFVARFKDTNDPTLKQKIVLEGVTFLFETTGSERFVDKPSVAAGPDGRVYAAFVVFDQQDPTRLSSKILMFSSSDYGQTFTGPIVVSQPLTRNQAPWIVVDPKNEQIVYIGWRVFASQTGGWTNAIVGKKSTNGGASFTPSVPYPVALLLKAFDAPQGNLSGPNPTLPSPRSNAYPTATIDGNGALHVAIQEYVYPSNHPISALRGLPLGPFASPAIGVPRITTTTSYNGGALWTIRRAADLGTAGSPAGSQFMPTLTAAGEPGPSCSGKTGPRSRVMLMYYDARAGGVGRAPGTPGYVVGGDKQFDVRIAQASACSSNGLSFSPSEQVSQYTRNAEAPFDIISTNSITAGGTTKAYTAVNRAYPTSCGGNCSFTGDYNHVVPRVPYVKTRSGQWKPTTAVTDPEDRDRLPAPVAQVVFADARDIAFPTMGSREFPLPPNASEIDALPWNVYQEPGTGLAPCINPGSRDLNVFTAEYTPGGLFASVPATFLNSGIPRSYPLYVENRTPQARHYRITIDANANASFDYTDFDGPGTPDDPKPNFGEPYTRVAGLSIGPISSVTGSIIVGPNVAAPVVITVEETGPPVTGTDPVTGLPFTRGGDVIAPPLGARTSVTFFSSGNDESLTETHQPVLYPTPIVTKPFEHLIPAGGFLLLPRSPAAIPSPTPFSPNPFSPNPFSPNPFSPNPFSPNPFSPNPFSPNPFSPNPFSPNPFSPNPFSPNPFSPNVQVYDVTDISYVVRNAGDQAAAFNAIASVLTAAPQNHAFQLLINRAVTTPVLIRDANGDCRAADSWQPVPISTIGNPFSPNPFSPNPFSPNPFSPNPFSPNPFSPNPFPSEFSNATFYVKPADATTNVQALVNNSQGFVADPPEDITVVTIRNFVLAANTPPIDPAEVNLQIEGQVPQQPVQGGGYEEETPTAGTQVPHQLAFTLQPAQAIAGVPLQPLQVTVLDAFGNPISGNASPEAPIALALGDNPGGAVLSGTLTKTTVNGVATFDDLVIDKVGSGYTLNAASGSLQPATSAAFNVVSIPVDIITESLPDATPAQPYSQRILTQHGTGAFTWTIEPIPGHPLSQLPPGLALDPDTGVISGTVPVESANSVWQFRVRVTDAAGTTDTYDACIRVDELPEVPIDGTLAAVSNPDALAVAQALVGGNSNVAIIPGSVSFTGAIGTAIGTFSGGFNATGIHSGIILSSGRVDHVNPSTIPGLPNDSDSKEFSNFPNDVTCNPCPSGDADLQGLIGPQPATKDAAVLEFDFSVADPDPDSDAPVVIKFDYVFASEEYNEFVNSQFNDVFGFFIHPQGQPELKENLARLAGTVPVSINTVNEFSLPEFYIDNDVFDPTPPEAVLATQADGLTKVLTVQTVVIPGQVYRLKIAIADTGDTRYDSWVLLKSGSLTVVCPANPGCPDCVGPGQ
jgi:hypothetical protein